MNKKLISALLCSSILLSGSGFPVVANDSRTAAESEYSENADVLETDQYDSDSTNNVEESNEPQEEIKTEEKEEIDIESESAVVQGNTELSTQSDSGVLHSGKIGTADWTIDENGILTIGEGELDNPNPDFVWPWKNYVSEVIAVDGSADFVVKGSLHNAFRSEDPRFSSSLENCSTIEVIDLSGWNTEAVTDTSGMFACNWYLKTLIIDMWDVSSVTDMNCMFAGCRSLDDIRLGDWDISSVKDLSGLFYDGHIPNSIDLSTWDISSVTDISSMFELTGIKNTDSIKNWNTSSVTNMAELFGQCRGLESVDLNNWDTSSVTSLGGMFRECVNLKSLDLNSWNTSSVKNMGSVFVRCSGLTELNIGDWDTSSVESMSSMFAGCSGLISLDIENWNTSSVKRLISSYYGYDESIFRDCSSLTSLDLSQWDTSSITDMSGMFSGCSNLVTLEIGTWDTSNVTKMGFKPLVGGSGMFNGCNSLVNLDIANWDTSSVAYFGGMFSNCSSLEKLDIGKWDTSSATNTARMFFDCKNLKSVDVSKWDMSNVESMEYMFAHCNSLTSIDVSFWNVSNVRSMQGLFVWCQSLDKIDVEAWDTSSVYDMDALFHGCSGITNLEVGSWDTSSVTNLGGMFYGCENLVSIDLENWDTSLVRDFSTMFEDCSSLTVLNLEQWDTSSATNLSEMFNGCVNLTSLSVGSWNTSLVWGMSSIFNGCRNIKEMNVEKWNTSSLVYADDIFKNCSGLDKLDLTTWDTSQVYSMSSMFDGCSNLSSLNIGNWDTRSVSTKSNVFGGCENLRNITYSQRSISILKELPIQTGWYLNGMGPYAISDLPEILGGNLGILTREDTGNSGIDISEIHAYGINQKYDHTGSEICPKPNLTVNSIRLIEGTDYTISYENNVLIGIASLTINGIGNYSGSITRTFEIVKPTVNIPFRVSSGNDKTVKVKWELLDLVDHTNKRLPMWDEQVRDTAVTSLSVANMMYYSANYQKELLKKLELLDNDSNFKEVTFNDLDIHEVFAVNKKNIDGTNYTFVTVSVKGTKFFLDETILGIQKPNFPNIWADISGIGFEAVAEMTVHELMDYLRTKGVSATAENTIFYINGHSLGGGIANCITKQLVDFGCKSNNVIAYTFASPYTYLLKRTIEYNRDRVINVFNFINTGDLVPKLSGYGLLFPSEDLSRFGLDYSIGTTDYDKFLDEYKQITGVEPGRGIFEAHSCYTYLAILKHSCSQIDVLSGNSFIARFECPVDVTLVDEDGNIIAYAKDNEYESYNPDVLVYSENGKKIFVLPYDLDYRFKISGTGEGEMSIYLQKDKEKFTNTESYHHVSITPSKTLILEPADIPDTTTLSVVDSDLNPTQRVDYQGNETQIKTDLSKAIVTGINESYSWTGDEISPKPEVMMGDKKLVEGNDYSLSYSDNIEPGTASVLITGVGDYSGSQSLTFQIIKQTSVPDTDDLISAIRLVETLNKNDYTEESWNILETALAKAKDALSSESQEEVDFAKEDLEECIASLVKKPLTTSIDYSDLKKAIEHAESLNESEYTPGSWASLQSKLEVAKKAMKATDQSEVNSALQELVDAIKNLAKSEVKKPQDDESNSDSGKYASSSKRPVTGVNMIGLNLTLISVAALGATLLKRKKLY